MTPQSTSDYHPLRGVVVALLIGLFSTVVFYWLGGRMDHAALQSQVRALHDARVSHLRILLETEMVLLQGLRGLYRASDQVTETEMQRYVAEVRQRAGALERVFWAPLEQGPNGGQTYQLRHMAPPGSGEFLLGMDLLQDPVLGPLAVDAASADALRMSRRMSLRNEGGGLAVNVALLPARSGAGHDSGLLVGVLRVEALLNRAIRSAAGVSGVLTTLGELEESGTVRILASSGAQQLSSYDSAMLAESSLEAGGITWRIGSAPTKAYVSAQGSYWRWWGLLYGVFGTLFTVTYLLRNYGEFRRVEQVVDSRTAALRFEEERVRQIIDLSHSGVVLADHDGRISLFNPGAERITGFRSSEVTGHLLGEVFPDSTLPEFGFAVETTLSRTEGSMVWVEMSVDRMQVQSQEYTLLVFTDITQRRAAAEEMDRARRAAEAAATVQEEFLANMSHEMRTPLNAILGMTSFLLEADLEVEQKQYAETLRVSGQNMLAMVNSVLDFYQLQRGRLSLDESDFMLRDCIEDTVTYFGRRANAKRLDLRLEYDERLPALVQGDASRLRQVLYNLISNAVKFTEHGEVCVVVEPARIRGTWLDLRITVRDTGIGIPKEQLPLLFQPFTQLDSSSARRYEGTGLGLVIARRLVELMGGSIEVSSGVGRGTEFDVRLSLQVAAMPSMHSRPDTAWWSGLQVMVVDDRPEDRATLENWLRRQGITAFVHGNGQDALTDLGEGRKPDVIFVDYMMPVLNGIEFARRLRGGPCADTYLVLTSTLRRGAFSGDDVALFDAYLEKPIIGSADIEAVLAPLKGRVRTRGRDGTGAQDTAGTQEAAQSERKQAIHVLVVDDNSVNQMVTRKLLEKCGCTADVAGNGLEAIEAVASKPYDIVFMDIQMPEMDGVEATRRILSRDDLPVVPVIIALTANTLPGEREQYMEAGMKDVLGKPVNMANLQSALDSHAAMQG